MVKMPNYLFNGVPLPKLPEWDKTFYPYALITCMISSSSTIAYLYCSTVPIYWKDDKTSLFAYVIAKENGSMICYACSTFPDGSVHEDWYRLEDGDKTVTAETKFAVYQTGSIKWANFDILNYSDDSVYLAASEPIPILAPALDPLSLFMGWKAGNWVARQRGKKKQPVAFLYNGVRLPKLPEWDKTVYPYAVIEYYGTTANLWVFDKPAGFKKFQSIGSTVYGIVLGTNDGSNINRMKANLMSGEIVNNPTFGAVSNHDRINVTKGDLLWANYDVPDYENDGTLYLAASEPVPVYE